VQTTYTGLRGYIEAERQMYAQHSVFGDLKGFSFTYADILEWFLENAEEFTGNNLDLVEEVRGSMPFKPEIKQCYHNSMTYQNGFRGNADIDYVEGWATSVIPLNHAWNVVNDRVADTTWALIREKESNDDYIGVRIPASFIGRVISHSSPYREAWCAGPFLYDYIAVQLMNEGEYERYFQRNAEEE
tara:strand:- start:53 stop:613 length:561 start_codon:yes stop_codon:yes gene_type:complete